MRFICLASSREELHLDSFAPIRALSLIWREIRFFTKAAARKFTKTEPPSPRAVGLLRLLSTGPPPILELIPAQPGRANKDMAKLTIKSTLCVINGSKQSPSIRTAVSPAARVKLPALGSLLLSLIQIRQSSRLFFGPAQPCPAAANGGNATVSKAFSRSERFFKATLFGLLSETCLFSAGARAY